MQFKHIILAAAFILAASMATAEAAPKRIDLGKLYEHFEGAGFSSLELMENARTISISGFVLEVGQSFGGNPILSVGLRANSRQIARLSAADDTQEDKLNALQVGGKFSAVCDLAFSSGTEYMSFQNCVFK